jgi:ubiquitin-conjugating enzyme E2 Q
MSPHANTSLSYSTMPYPSGANSTALTWPNSELKISTTISLQEVVNCPTEFVSQTPHYVVNQLDWIQTRYLFVKTEANCQTQTSAPSLVFQQDKTRAAIGPGGAAVSIPITAVSKSRRPGVETKTLPNGSKKAKAIGITNQQSAEDAEDDRDSVISDQADREYLDSDMEDSYTSPAVQEEINNINSPRAKRPRDPDVSQTDFVPGSLDMSSIKILKQPAFATPQATKRLSKTLQELVKVQNGSKLHELGWWIDVDQVENLYQWIIELHSFDKTLPLADDMKKAGITSIVLEMRFTPSFPFFPPFVRVVRPRFLPFLSGGGGHVTAGGAICMQLLTNDGWLVTNSIESVLLQIRMAISSIDPRPARLESRGARYGDTTSSYSVGEAIEAFKRACRTHGWQIPEDIDMLAQQE